MGETYYDVLEVDPDATRDEIESAYRDRVLETHPDHSDDPDAAERFQRVTTARSVLTDGTERARYDRLGHETYVGLARETNGGADSSGGDGFDRSVSETRTEAETGGGAGTAGAAGDGDRPGSDGGRTSDRTGQTRTESARSHHARQRSRRRRQRATRRAAGEWPFGTDDAAATESGATETTSGTGATKTSSGGRSTADSQSPDGFQYSVHDWDGEVDLEWTGPRLDGATAISVGAVSLLYPVFVAASLTPLFSVPINAIVAACTLALVGYLLTMPRIAMVAFGGWSVLFPVGMVTLVPIDPLSLFGLLSLGFVWVPFGYAVALWWVLRP